MRVLVLASLPLALAAAPPSSAPPPVTPAMFEQSVAVTKQAMMADPEHALTSAMNAVALARRLPPSHNADVAIATAEWLHGEALLYLNKPTEAKAVVEPTLRSVERIDPNSKLHGDLLRSHGAIAASDGQVLQALRDYQRAHDVFRAAGVPRSQAMALQDIGVIYMGAGDYARALDYYRQAIESYHRDPVLTLTTLNNRGEVLRKTNRYAEAAVAYRAALIEARRFGSSLLQTRILTNLAKSEAEAGHLASAQRAADQALRLAANGEAAGWKSQIYGVEARIAIDRGDLNTAAAMIRRTFAGIDPATSEMVYRDYHATATRVFEQLGDTQSALIHLKAVQRLDSEAQALTASAAAQLTGARFDFANQNAKISHLKQAQLESAVQLERQRGRLTTLALAALVLIAALLAIGFASLRRSRNETRAANRVLSDVNDRLEGALKAKTDFLATTSHEIRTPLNGILGMTQILLADRKLPAETREQIEVVHGAGETMRALVDDILDVAKMETGELHVAAEPTPTRTILEETARLWRGHAEGKGIDLSLSIEGVPDLIRSDPMRLRQLVFNLVSNAIKFTPAGSIAIRARSEADTLVIDVADSGIGIPADQLDLIFDPFHQVDGGTTRQFSGTGLGLAICRKIAVALGGGITVASEIGRGTTFTLTLPLVAEAAPAAPSSPVPASERTAGLLLIEGNPLTQGVMRNLLEPHYPALRVAADGDAALAMIDGGRERQLLLDARAARMDSRTPLDALRTIVDRARAAGMHITLMLAPDDELPIEAVATVGADQLVLKPVSGAALIARLVIEVAPPVPAPILANAA